MLANQGPTEGPSWMVQQEQSVAGGSETDNQLYGNEANGTDGQHQSNVGGDDNMSENYE